VSVIELERQDEVFVLRMVSGENRFHRQFLDELQAALDEVEAVSGPAALVTTGLGKFYSNGLDLDWVLSQEDGGRSFIADLLRCFARILSSPLPTVAAVNGHAFAGGGMLALTHDYRVMRADRGFFCLPEIDLGMPLVAGMTALIREKIPAGPALRDAVLAGRRMDASACMAGGFVDDAVCEEQVLARAMELVAPLAAKHAGTRQTLKRGLYEATLAVLESPERSIAVPRLD
jgi:enoyl-CoA hydratase/carnithine racemase